MFCDFWPVPNQIFISHQQFILHCYTYHQLKLMLCLHYVPGHHDSRDSPKRSAPWFFVIFVFAFKFCYISLRFLTVYQGIRDRAWVLNPGDSPVQCFSTKGLPRLIVRFLPACHVLLGPLMFCHVSIEFCHV